jgi:hypothetical protein
MSIELQERGPVALFISNSSPAQARSYTFWRFRGCRSDCRRTLYPCNRSIYSQSKSAVVRMSRHAVNAAGAIGPDVSLPQKGYVGCQIAMLDKLELLSVTIQVRRYIRS